MMQFPEIPIGSALGLNYSGLHDSAIAVVAPSGEPVFAVSLERLSRVKQDGRPPHALLENIPWERIAKVAVSTESAFHWPKQADSKLLEVRLPQQRMDGLCHGQPFYDFLELIPGEKEFVCHELSHASSAFWGSGFDDALCLTYDGGMFNSPWFGGLYRANRHDGIQALDQFSALHYAKVTSLYTFVTALLGFTPNQHEGKITGLAAYGRPTDSCRALMKHWFEDAFLEIESVVDWMFAYDNIQPPVFLTDEARIEPFRQDAAGFSREEIAATIQEFAEDHVLGLLSKAKALGWTSDNICLAGGLFSNVRINQRVVETGFKNLFVAPPMTDDGTALGAAWHVLSRQPAFSPQRLRSLYLGPGFPAETVRETLVAEGVKFEQPANREEKLATLLADGAVVALFQNGMEFGPRALGNRSILVQATEADINRSLNERLGRTEFMPFAPISRVEDAAACYHEIDRVSHAVEFMTVTVNCTKEMRESCPAVVHVDGTARPQLVSAQINPLIHRVLTHYEALTKKLALVNTSFNLHEEPIVCSPADALKGFFESGIDYLYFGNGLLVSFSENKDVALRYLQEKQRQPSHRSQVLASIVRVQSKALHIKKAELIEKERVIAEQAAAQSRVYALLRPQGALEAQLIEKERVIQEQARALRAFRSAAPFLRFIMPLVRVKRRVKSILRPRLGNLNQYAPRPLASQASSIGGKLPVTAPRISIVTPSFRQGIYIERTLRSVLEQGYPNLEYFVQDGGFTDQTVSILKSYEGQLSGWRSQKDNGQAQGINLGFAKTTGEIMAWLNSDDLLLPGALACVADYFARHPEVDVVYGNRLLIDEHDMEIGRWLLPGHDNKVLSWVDYVPQESLFWRRSIWEKVGGKVDESFRFAMDWDLLVRFRDAEARFAHIPYFLGAFRVHAQQKSSAAMSDVGVPEMNRIRQRVLGRVPSMKEIQKAVKPFLAKHVAVDMAYRIKSRIGRRRIF